MYCSALTGALSFSRSHTARASIGSCTIALRSRGGLRTGDFRSHADFIAAMVDGIALNKPDEDFLHHLSANEVFPDVLYRASVNGKAAEPARSKLERLQEAPLPLRAFGAT